ncbi:ATP-binding protein [Mycoplasmopsis cynos]|nr:ATP-binding protein [Mycoplasmopsis cynos]
MNKRFLLAVSGGPDSMFMLNKYKYKDIVVMHR